MKLLVTNETVSYYKWIDGSANSIISTENFYFINLLSAHIFGLQQKEKGFSANWLLYAGCCF